MKIFRELKSWYHFPGYLLLNIAQHFAKNRQGHKETIKHENKRIKIRNNKCTPLRIK